MKRKAYPICHVTVALLLSGCATPRIPFEPIRRVPVANVQPGIMKLKFATAVPSTLRIENTVTFRFRRRETVALGLVSARSGSQKLTVVCLSHVGLKLFEIVGKGDTIEHSFAIPEFAKHRDFIPTVYNDIRKAYFDLLPAPGAEVDKQELAIVFRQEGPEGAIEHVFGGADGVLIEKRYYEGRRRICTVAYYEYRKERGCLYPGGIILTNHKYGYSIIVRLKRIL
jgi:hypothetical protein